MAGWIEVSLEVDGEGAEAAAEALRPYVHQGLSVEHLYPGEAWEDEPAPPVPLIVRGYIPDNDEAPAVQRRIEEALYYLGRLYPLPAPTFRRVQEEDWADAWKRHYHPIRVGRSLLIKPAWIDMPTGPDDVVIEMDPGMAFGTGTHPTTQLCLQACEWFSKPGSRMVDLGTGSGILAIAAVKLGCFRALAIDNDEIAVQVTRENAERNGVADRVIPLHGSLESLRRSARHFDWGIANLTARIILDLAPQGLQHIVWPGGKLVFSGIIDEQAPEVIAALEAIDLEVVGQSQLADWVLLVTRRRRTE